MPPDATVEQLQKLTPTNVKSNSTKAYLRRLKTETKKEYEAKKSSLLLNARRRNQSSTSVVLKSRSDAWT
jgi:hypothetical protein